VLLAAAMDSRGYGRRGDVSRRSRRISVAALLGGLVAACIGAYGLVSAGSPTALGLPMLLVGAAIAGAGVIVSSRSSVRTVYRPDPWRAPEWLVLLAGVLAVLAFLAADWLGIPGMDAPIDPPGWPALPLLAVAGVLVAATPAVTAPQVPDQFRTRRPTVTPPTAVVIA
jgi:energy-coupling factor transport system permease protein